ncbi:MAG: family 10 glycosylhydrolase [Planctomycetota bacterium]
MVSAAPALEPPTLDRELRAAWIATVANIDWPSKPGLAPAEQRAELAELLDQCADLGMNAVVLQVRPACDALYRSDLEPWSSFLSGVEGVGPDDYDPLEWACEQAHRRGLELHAWLNPYRASHPSYRGEPAESSLSKTRPDLVRSYGVYDWLDPGEAEAAEHSLAVVRDIVRRYDVDAIHFDDYFYPYPVSDALDGDPDGDKVEIPFPDEPSWQKYLAATPEGERMSRDDWRRDNVNRFIQRCNEVIHEEKPHVRFGVSPFGIWRPGNPAGIQGFDQYAKLYADARLWLREGWVDYLAPQLYWPIEQKPQSYTALLDWWTKQNPQGRGLMPGLFTSKVSFDPPKYNDEEIPRQIQATRARRGADGHIHFSMKAIAKNARGVADRLAELYAEPALPPAAPWLAGDMPAPGAPSVERADGDSGAYQLKLGAGPTPRWWLLQKRCGDDWSSKLRPVDRPEVVARLKPDAAGRPPEQFAVRTIDAFGRLSEATCVDVSPVAVAP